MRALESPRGLSITLQIFHASEATRQKTMHTVYRRLIKPVEWKSYVTTKGGRGYWWTTLFVNTLPRDLASPFPIIVDRSYPPRLRYSDIPAYPMQGGILAKVLARAPTVARSRTGVNSPTAVLRQRSGFEIFAMVSARQICSAAH